MKEKYLICYTDLQENGFIKIKSNKIVFMENVLIFKKLSNPWTDQCTKDITTSLDILSTATQTQDLGAKILQIYCCLEHLFVPKDVQTDNIKYIKGAINVLEPNVKYA